MLKLDLGGGSLNCKGSNSSFRKEKTGPWRRKAEVQRFEAACFWWKLDLGGGKLVLLDSKASISGWRASGSGRTGKGLLAKGYRFKTEFD
jgi:hypothetical protein